MDKQELIALLLEISETSLEEVEESQLVEWFDLLHKSISNQSFVKTLDNEELLALSAQHERLTQVLKQKGLFQIDWVDLAMNNPEYLISLLSIFPTEALVKFRAVSERIQDNQIRQRFLQVFNESRIRRLHYYLLQKQTPS